MRIPREAMTPTLTAALAVFVSDVSPSPETSSGPNRARALLKAQSDLETSRGYAAFFSVMAAAFIGLFLLAGESPFLTLIPGALVATTVALTLKLHGQRPDGPSPTTEFLGAALDRLELGPVQRRYAEALVAVQSGEVRDPGGDSLTLLRRLADEEDRLARLLRTVDSPGAEEVAAEGDELQRLRNQAGDPSTREALDRSLALVQKRVEIAERAGEMRSRLDAHRRHLEQSAQMVAQGIMGWTDLPTETDGLRENLAALGRESQALEAAVQEMRAL